MALSTLQGSLLSEQLAVNEAFIGEADPSRPLLFEMAVDDGAVQLHRSSGVLISSQVITTVITSDEKIRRRERAAHRS